MVERLGGTKPDQPPEGGKGPKGLKKRIFGRFYSWKKEETSGPCPLSSETKEPTTVHKWAVGTRIKKWFGSLFRKQKSANERLESFSTLVGTNNKISELLNPAEEKRKEYETFLLESVGNKELNAVLYKKVQKWEILSQVQKMLLRLSYCSRDDFLKANQALEKLKTAEEILQFKELIQLTDKFTKEQQSLCACLNEIQDLSEDKKGLRNFLATYSIQTFGEMISSQHTIELYTRVSKHIETVDEPLKTKIVEHIASFHSLKERIGRYEQQIQECSYSRLTLAELRAMEKVMDLSKTFTIEEGKDLEDIFLDPTLKEMFSTSIKSKETFAMFGRLLQLLPGYANGDIRFTQENILHEHKGKRGPAPSTMDKRRMATWMKFVKTLFSNPWEARAFFTGVNCHSSLTYMSLHIPYSIDIQKNVIRSRVKFSSAICDVGYRAKLSTIFTDEEKRIMLEEGKKKNSLYSESDLEFDLQEIYKTCLQGAISEEKTKNIVFGAARAISSVLKHGQIGKRKKSEEIVPMPKLKENERQNMVCAEFIARIHDAVALKMNRKIQKVYGITSKPFRTFVTSEREYQLIYPKRLAGLMEGHGYKKLHPPMVVRLLVDGFQESVPLAQPKIEGQ